MNNNRILLNNINLHYASVAYKERSIKTLFTSFMRGAISKAPIADIHALKNITIDIRAGEKVGLLGHNGAGKSTFLKTVAGLYPTSSGEMCVTGQVRSLFDLSLGFELEATGRENILYRGLLLGLSPREMKLKEKEIVEFADLGEFIDYPIKTYSSGMQVRLAFAVSTAVSGDILLLDEVIGAGDANFMLKAKQRIQKLIENAEILILASHDLITLSLLCTRGIVFHHGEIAFDGNIDDAIKAYRQINGLI